MLILVATAALGAGCTPKEYCDSVSLGQPLPSSAKPAPPPDSWCAGHPRRDFVGPEGLADAGADIFSYGEFDGARSEQCCLSVRDGGVLAKWLGYD